MLLDNRLSIYVLLSYLKLSKVESLYFHAGKSMEEVLFLIWPDSFMKNSG